MKKKKNIKESQKKYVQETPALFGWKIYVYM